jgi:hypothetical protein
VALCSNPTKKKKKKKKPQNIGCQDENRRAVEFQGTARGNLASDEPKLLLISAS